MEERRTLSDKRTGPEKGNCQKKNKTNHLISQSHKAMHGTWQKTGFWSQLLRVQSTMSPLGLNLSLFTQEVFSTSVLEKVQEGRQAPIGLVTFWTNFQFKFKSPPYPDCSIFLFSANWIQLADRNTIKTFPCWISHFGINCIPLILRQPSENSIGFKAQVQQDIPWIQPSDVFSLNKTPSESDCLEMLPPFPKIVLKGSPALSAGQ